MEVPSVNGEPMIVTTHQRGGRDALRIAAPAGRQSPAAQNARAVPMELEALVRQLRRTYGRLDDFRRATTLTQATERRRQQTLVEYDRQLLNVCAVLGIPTGLADGEAMTVEARGVLTRALARAGFDVRAEIRQAPAQKAWRMRLNHRF